MKSRRPYRRHSTPFKLQLCPDIRNGVMLPPNEARSPFKLGYEPR